MKTLPTEQSPRVMNVIQVGRPAVSRYYQQRRFFYEAQAPEHKTHDFPTAHLGIKLGGFMILLSVHITASSLASKKRRSASLHQ